MAIDLTGISNINEYYTNHYLNSVFEENASDTISKWRNEAKEREEIRTPWSLLRESAKQYYIMHEKRLRTRSSQMTPYIRDMADIYLSALGYKKTKPFTVSVDEGLNSAYVYTEIKKQNGAPLLWVLLSNQESDEDTALLYQYCFDVETLENPQPLKSSLCNEDLATKIFYSLAEAPRWLIIIGENSAALLDRNKWNEKRFLEFDLEEIFRRREESTLQAMSVLLYKDSICPDEGIPLLDTLDENSHKHASGVSQDLKYALRESIELLGNEILFDMVNRQGVDLNENPVDAGELSIQCLRYMYRMLFLLFIEARPELGYAPMKSQVYLKGYSLESLRDIADNIREETSEVGKGYYLHDTLSKLYDLIYNGYPKTEEELRALTSAESFHDIFIIDPLKAHIFDPEYTKFISRAKLRNSVMLKIIDLMSITRPTGRRNDKRGRISYAALGINQMGAVYEALLSYRGFIAQETLFEVKRERDEINELDVGYFVHENELSYYTEDERARYEDGKLRRYEKGTFIYRLAGREREKSASYYTPEVLTKCLVKYALKELLENKTADEILHLTICEPAMGSAAFLNEAINQLAEAYLDKKQKELGESITHEERFSQLQKVKMFIADRNVYGIDLNPIAVELAEVSLWLNTIYKGGLVPWFGTQLVNGNSLIGARRQCYRVEQLQTASSGIRWYDNEPERVQMNSKRMLRKQIYHFLTGDPGMSSYTDKIIKSLAPDKIKTIKSWNTKFTKPFGEDDIQNLLRLSSIIDELWEKQVKLRKEVREKTSDVLTVYGQDEETQSSHTTIREKDMIYKLLYKSEEQKNAGPYARLKFAMDYWCSLWFWPIDKSELLPTRSEFIADMYLILEGTINTFKGVNEQVKFGQMSMFMTEQEQLLQDINKLYSGLGIVDISKLCQQQPRLALARNIAKQQRFIHWELEFADLFAERGGFDLILGNPPWIRMGWNEQSVLSDKIPLFIVKDLTATQTTHQRAKALEDNSTLSLYFEEYESMLGSQNFLNAVQNYPDLIGQQTNLYKCFLPQSWQFTDNSGISAFLHPDGVYDDPKGGVLREKLYPKLRKHFQFTNELKLFSEVDHHMGFSINIYCNKPCSSFESIGNLFTVNTIEQCYDQSITGKIPGIKDEDSNWNINGHPKRIVHVSKKDLELFANIFDGSDNWKQARLPVIHTVSFINVLNSFYDYPKKVSAVKEELFATVMWDETQSQVKGILMRDVHFPEETIDLIYSGPHIGVANPMFKCSRKICKLNSDYDNLDLNSLPKDYRQRCNYTPAVDVGKYVSFIQNTKWGTKYHSDYKILSRTMLNLSGERSLVSSIVPKNTGHINGLFGIAFLDKTNLVSMQAMFASLVYDFFVKVVGMSNFRISTVLGLPLIKENIKLNLRSLLLVSVNQFYSELWVEQWDNNYIIDGWSKVDPRLSYEKFTSLTQEWTWDTPLRTDYERRQALVEIDVLTAMALGITLEQLKTIYRIQFPVLQQYEADTWYDQNGRIVFTNNRSLTGVGFSRIEFDNIKETKVGERFYRTITDDTQLGGPMERTIEYVAPFDKCDREQDYETAWKFFEEKYK